jgi:hypothetical protein
MSYFDFPPGQRVLREFKDNRDPNGRLIAAEAPWVTGWGVRQHRRSGALRLVAGQW